MATNAKINFNYSDNNNLCCIYIRTDAFAEDIANLLINICDKIDYQEAHAGGRLDWNFYVTKIISDFVLWHNRLDHIAIIEPEEDFYTIINVDIIPIKEYYSNQKYPLKNILNVIFKHSYNDIIYSGILSEFYEPIED